MTTSGMHRRPFKGRHLVGELTIGPARHSGSTPFSLRRGLLVSSGVGVVGGLLTVSPCATSRGSRVLLRRLSSDGLLV